MITQKCKPVVWEEILFMGSLVLQQNPSAGSSSDTGCNIAQKMKPGLVTEYSLEKLIH